MKQVFSTGNVLEANENGYSIIRADGSKVDFDSFGNRISNGDELAKNARLGEFVEYIPNKTSYVVNERESGYYGIQYYTPSHNRLWRVFGKDGDFVDLISNSIVGTLKLTGKTGHSNFPKILDEFANAFVNPQFALSGRSVGKSCVACGRGMLDMGDAESLYIQADKGYEADLRIISEKGLDVSAPIWLYSRCIRLYDNASFYGIRTLVNGEVDECVLCSEVNGEVHEKTKEFGVRLVIKLKPTVTISGGMGTNLDPYSISI